MSSIPDAHGVRQHADDLAPDSSPAVPFTEAQARAWVAANGTKSVRLLAKLWGWSVGKVQRFLNRVQTDSPDSPDSPSDSPESPTESEPPGPPELDPNEFDLKRSECVLPARTFVSAYIDDNGDLLTRPAWKRSGLRRTATWNRPLINGPPFSRVTSHRIDDYRHMNHILTLQNAEPQLRLLRARRYTYLIGKRLLSLQVFLTVGVPVIGALGVLFWPNLKAYVAIASLVIAILDVTLFDRVQRTLRKRAATMQEQFDCIVLELPWEKFTVGAKLEPETIHAAASKHLGGADDPNDWYPAVVGDVPLYLARIICQRTNLWYDAKLRRQYGASVLGGTIALTVLLFVFGLIGGHLGVVCAYGSGAGRADHHMGSTRILPTA